MERHRDYRSLFYSGMTLMIVVLFGNALLQNIRSADASEREDRKLYPQMSWQELYNAHERLRPVAERGAATIEEYFSSLKELYSLLGSAERARDASLPLDPRYPQSDMLMFSFLIDQLARPDRQQALIKRFGDHEWMRVRDQTHIPVIDNLKTTSPLTWLETFSWLRDRLFWWVIAQIGVMPFMLIHLALKNRDQDGSVFLDFLSNPPRFVFAVVFWEWGLCKYRITKPKQQFINAARLVVQFATFVIAAGLSTFVSAGRIAKATTVEEEQGGAPITYVPSIAYNLSTQFMPKYLGTLGGAIFHDAPVEQTEFTLAFPRRGWYFDVWNSVPLGQRDIVPNYGQEIDYTLGKQGTIPRLHLAYIAYFEYIDVYRLFEGPWGDDLNLGLWMGKKFALSDRQTLTPYFKVVEALPARGPTPKSGTFVFLGAQQQRKLGKQVSLGADISVNHDSGTFGFNPGWIARGSGSLNFKLSKRATLLAPVLQTSSPITHTADGRKFQFLVGAGLAYSW